MSQQSAIEWTDATWNPVTGCDRVSPGCKHCYALDLAARLKRMGQPRYQRDGRPPTSGPGFGVTLHEDKLEEPLRWRKPRMVFVNSMSDLFHPEVPDEFIGRVFAAMGAAPQHTFQVLTKRPERMREVLAKEQWETDDPFIQGYADHDPPSVWPLPNVWLGTSIESRTYVGRADHLRATPAAVRFISAEPLLGPLVDRVVRYTNGLGHRVEEGELSHPTLDLTGIDWLIAGGESGPNHRPMDPQWVRDLRDACLLVDAPECEFVPGESAYPLPELHRPAFFFKQWGGRTPKAGGRELDGRTWDEMPARPDRDRTGEPLPW